MRDSMTVDFLSLMMRAGWQELTIAPETGSERTLRIMQKDLDLDVVNPFVQRCHAVGMKVKANFIIVKRNDGSVELRAECSGLVICARETKPTPNLEERVAIALSSLYIRRPKKDLYTKALIEAKKRIDNSKYD